MKELYKLTEVRGQDKGTNERYRRYLETIKEAVRSIKREEIEKREQSENKLRIN